MLKYLFFFCECNRRKIEKKWTEEKVAVNSTGERRNSQVVTELLIIYLALGCMSVNVLYGGDRVGLTFRGT